MASNSKRVSAKRPKTTGKKGGSQAQGIPAPDSQNRPGDKPDSKPFAQSDHPSHPTAQNKGNPAHHPS